jgi:hypothetical protein
LVKGLLLDEIKIRILLSIIYDGDKPRKATARIIINFNFESKHWLYAAERNKSDWILDITLLVFPVFPRLHILVVTLRRGAALIGAT